LFLLEYTNHTFLLEYTSLGTVFAVMGSNDSSFVEAKNWKTPTVLRG
jgi:hypothetical protein